jgi:hypothetical protein
MFQITASAGMSSMHMIVRRPMRFMCSSGEHQGRRSTFLQSLEYVDDGHATGYQLTILKGEGRRCLT